MRRSAGVLDAGVVLARLDHLHRSHGRIRALLERGRDGDLSLWISVVNLAEVLQHSRRYSEATGLDPVALLGALRVRVHQPDIPMARRVAELASIRNASLADRFAAVTAESLSARLYTTDSSLARSLRKERLSCTVF